MCPSDLPKSRDNTFEILSADSSNTRKKLPLLSNCKNLCAHGTVKGHLLQPLVGAVMLEETVIFSRGVIFQTRRCRRNG